MTFAAPKSGTWQSLLAESISKPSEIACRLGISAESISETPATYPARINPYALGLIRSAGGGPFMIDDSRLFSVISRFCRNTWPIVMEGSLWCIISKKTLYLSLITMMKRQEPERK